MYYKNELDLLKCKKTFKYHFDNNIWSYFTVKIMLNLLDIVSQEELRAPGASALLNHHRFLQRKQNTPYKPDIFKMHLNITIQYINIRFAEYIRISSTKFEKEIDFILNETNAYIPRFVTHTDMPVNREKQAILVALFTVGSGMFSAWCFYKDYTFKCNLRQMLHHILNDHKHFGQVTLSNRRNLVSLADNTASNFKFLHEKFEGLRNITFEYFQSYTSFLIATNGVI